jgi:Multimeric flavodoxin WrbA
METCEILLKEALFKAQETGAEISFIRMYDMDIGPCTGCAACSEGVNRGKQSKCVVKDDYNFVEDKILDADAIILAVPIYVLTPQGQFLNLVHRLGPAHDMARMRIENERRKKENIEPLDPRIFRQKYTGYISVGGASTENWVSLGLPLLHLFGMSMLMKTVGHVNVVGYRHHGNPVLCEELMGKVGKLGRDVTEAIGKAPEDVAWCSDEGTCPVCHNNLLTIKNTTTVECPICGIYGEISINNGKLAVIFSEAEQKRARFTEAGLKEHFEEINTITGQQIESIQKAKDKLPLLLKKYQDFKPIEQK